MTRTKAVLALAVVLAGSALSSVALLERRANESRKAQLTLAQVKLELSNLQTAPFRANPKIGGSPEKAKEMMTAGKAGIREALAALGSESAPVSIQRIAAPLRANYEKLDRIYVLGATGVGYEEEADRLAFLSRKDQAVVMGLLDEASRWYDRRAWVAQAEATAGASLVILALLGAFAFFYLRSVRMTRKLEAAQHERTRLLERTVEVAEHERIRVAADLHDGPIQQLTAVALNMDRFTQRIARGELERAAELGGQLRDQLSTEMVSLRRLMAELRPPILDEGGLSAALNDCAEQVVEPGVSCRVRSTIGDVALAPEIETVVYRVAREALINARKHARASRVDVVLERVGDRLRLTVADDGCGFAPEAPGALANGERYGLLGMRERVESVGGLLVVDANPDAGVRIVATLPSKPRVAGTIREVDRAAA